MRTDAEPEQPQQSIRHHHRPVAACWSSRWGTAIGTFGPRPRPRTSTSRSSQISSRSAPVLPPAQRAELGRKAPVEPGARAGVLVVDDEVGHAPSQPAAEPGRHRDRELEVGPHRRLR